MITAYALVRKGKIVKCNCHPSGLKSYVIYVKRPNKTEGIAGDIVKVEIK
jgi:hypothetical protein